MTLAVEKDERREFLVCLGAWWSRIRDQCWQKLGMKTSMGVSHKSTLLFFCSMVLLVSAGQGQGHHQNCFLFLFLGCLPWINVDTPPSQHTI